MSKGDPCYLCRTFVACMIQAGKGLAMSKGDPCEPCCIFVDKRNRARADSGMLKSDPCGHCRTSVLSDSSKNRTAMPKSDLWHTCHTFVALLVQMRSRAGQACFSLCEPCSPGLAMVGYDCLGCQA